MLHSYFRQRSTICYYSWAACFSAYCDCVVVNGTPSHSYGVSLAIWYHTVLPARRHKWTHPVSAPARNRYSIYLTRRDGRLSWPRWLVYIPIWFTRLQAVTHPGTNRTQCRLTTLIEANALTATLRRHPVVGIVTVIINSVLFGGQIDIILSVVCLPCDLQSRTTTLHGVLFSSSASTRPVPPSLLSSGCHLRVSIRATNQSQVIYAPYTTLTLTVTWCRRWRGNTIRCSRFPLWVFYWNWQIYCWIEVYGRYFSPPKLTVSIRSSVPPSGSHK